MKRMLKVFAVISVQLIAGAQSWAGVGVQTAEGPVALYNPEDNNTNNIYYLEFLPPDYNDPANINKKYPVIVSLHGSGEGGSGAAGIASYLADPKNGPPKLVQSNPAAMTFTVNGQSQSCILISPQGPGGSSTPSYITLGVLKHVLQTLRVDETRIYLTGLSSGGRGTWEAAGSDENDEADNFFAALAPVVAVTTPAGLGTQVAAWNLPVWSFSGELDSLDTDNYQTLLPIREMITAGKTPKVTVFAGSSHSQAWTKAYNLSPSNPAFLTTRSPSLPSGYPMVGLDNTTVYNWLLQQVKTAPRNARPHVTTAAIRTVRITDTTILQAIVSDDGLPAGSVVSNSWSKTSGPGLVVFGTPNQAVTSASFSQTGTYVLTLSASDTARTTNRAVTIEVVNGNPDGTLFSQDFSSGTTLSAYIATIPSNSDFSHFNDISASASGGTWSLTGGSLQLVKPTATTNTGAGFIRMADLIGPPAVVKVEFDMSVLLNEAAANKDLVIPVLGNFASVGVYSGTEGGNIVAERWAIRSKVNSDNSTAFQIRHNNLLSSQSLPANGSPHHFAWFFNVTSTTKMYTGPDGSTRSLNPFCSSIWVDNVPWIDSHTRESGFSVNDIRDFKFRMPSGLSSTFKFDNLKIYEVASGIPAPTAVNDTASTNENVSVDTNVLTNDTGSSISLLSVGAAAHGATSIVAGLARYMPDTGYSGIDNFSYTITDGTATATANVTVTVLNVPPTAQSDTATTPEGVSINVNVLANDSGPNPLTLQSVTTPANGTTAIVAGQVRYTPNAGFFGQDSFSYIISDGGDSATATVTMTVNDTSSAHNLTGQGLTGINIGTGSGSSRVLSGGDWELRGSGSGSTGSTDNIYNESTDITGNFVLVVNVKGLTGGTNPRAGLMLRESNNAGARMVYLGTDTGTGYHFSSRTTNNGSMVTESSGPVSFTYPNAWLMMERVGDTIYLAVSNDGENFVETGVVTLNGLTGTVKAALFTSSGSTGVESRAILSDFALDPTSMLFLQNFQGSTDYTTYFNATNPGTNQFNDISASTNGGTWSVNGNQQLQLVRAGVSNSTNGAGLSRTTAFATSPTVLCLTFTMGLTINSTQNDMLIFDVGQIPSVLGNNSSTPTANTFAQLHIDGSGSNHFRLEMGGTQTADYNANGTTYTVAWYLNKSGTSQTFTGPDGLSHTVSANRCTIFVNNALALTMAGNAAFNDVAVTNGASSTLKNARIHLTTGDNGTWKFDNFSVENGF